MLVPPGFAIVTPYLIADDAAGLIAFLTAAFGGREIGRTTGAGGRIANAQVEIDGCVLMLSAASPEYPAMPGSYYLYVADAEATMAAALAAGGNCVMAVSDQPYGDRQGGIRDGNGNYWWVSQRLVDGPYH